MATEFQRRVLSIVRRIPPGRVATYGDVAALAGAPRAARAVGTVLRNCRDPGIPCHRVIAAGGGLGGFGGTLQIKRERLRAEGLDVGVTRVRRFTAVRWPRHKEHRDGLATTDIKRTKRIGRHVDPNRSAAAEGGRPRRARP
jgi:O-6-methylguanine DNA methyltransferase